MTGKGNIMKKNLKKTIILAICTIIPLITMACELIIGGGN
jgi:hypothetical protein